LNNSTSAITQKPTDGYSPSNSSQLPLFLRRLLFSKCCENDHYNVTGSLALRLVYGPGTLLFNAGCNKQVFSAKP